MPALQLNSRACTKASNLGLPSSGNLEAETGWADSGVYKARWWLENAPGQNLTPR
jgi:hypothetical protein